MNLLDEMPPQNTSLELDSHADKCCAGSNCHVIKYTNRSCEVSAFSSHHDVLSNVPIVKVGTAYDAPNEETYTLVLSQSLYLCEYMTDSLLCPNQV